jgi:hypothetical protein
MMLWPLTEDVFHERKKAHWSNREKVMKTILTGAMMVASLGVVQKGAV